MKKFFSPDKKAEILAFVEKYNLENGRGGQVVAGKKFKVSRVTLIAWKKNGVPVKKVEASRPTPKPAKAKSVIQESNPSQSNDLIQIPRKTVKLTPKKAESLLQGIELIKAGIAELEMTLRNLGE
jgi:hypothetical protein